VTAARPLRRGSLPRSHEGAPAEPRRTARSAKGVLRRFASTAASAAFGLLSACASLQPPHTSGAQLLTGRLSVRVESEPVKALSAAFELSGDAREGALALTSPLGNTLAQARWRPDDVVLETPGSRARYADLDALAVQALGERVPLAALFDWLRGRPWPGARSDTLAGGEAGFTQLGWRVGLARYAEGWVEARRDAPPAVTVRARLDPPASP
jgi:outer membrane lipoprotein LolB